MNSYGGSGHVRRTALLLTFATGLTGLVYEVTWQRYLATLLGSHAEATAAVLAIFLGGLSLGYALFGGVSRRALSSARAAGRPVRLLRLYGWLELGIGCYALLFPVLFGMAQSLSVSVPTQHASSAFAFDVALAALLIGPPTVLMGGTIPILTLALPRSVEEATSVHAQVYGLNTFGAFAGALLGGFVFVPRLGLDGCMHAMAAINLVAGVGFLVLDRRCGSSGGVAVVDPTSDATGAVPRFAAYAGVALVGGFAMMALQTTLNRLGALAFGASQFTFSIVVAVFVLSTALGSLAVAALHRIPRALLVGSQWVLVALLLGLFTLVPDANYWAHSLRVIFQPVDAAFYPYQLVVFGALLAILALPIGLSGAMLPLLFHHLRGEMGSLGSVAGRLYAWNTVGSLVGALLGGYVLLFWLDLHHIYRIALVALTGGAVALCGLVLRGPARATALLAVPALALVSGLPAWSPDRLSAGVFRLRTPTPTSFDGPTAFFAAMAPTQTVFFDDDPTATVSVRERELADGGFSRAIIVNGKSDGDLVGDYATMALAALVPALLAERNERAFVIGWGTGVTAGELAALDDFRDVEVAEISPAVLEAAPLFDFGNLAASRSPKVQLARADAYRALLRSEYRYDVIVSEPSNPWVSGVEMLFSAEFLAAARSRLAPGGVYAQWIHTYASDAEAMSLVLRTYAEVFEHVSVWFAVESDVLLLGFDRPERALDVAALRARFLEPDFQRAFARTGVLTFPALLSHEVLPLGTLHVNKRPGVLHTLRHPRLSDLAARAFFRGQNARVPRLARPEHAAVGTRNSLLRRASPPEAAPERVLEDVTRELCRSRRDDHCATFLALWSLRNPGSARWRATVAEAREAMVGGRAFLSPERLGKLRRLYAGTMPEESITSAEAVELTADYVAHYHHAAPFARASLAAIWERCASEDCAERLREATQSLGPLQRQESGR